MRLNRRSFWGLFVGLFAGIPFLRKEIPTYNKDEWVYHPLRREHQDMLLSTWTADRGSWSPVECPYDPYDSTWRKEWGTFGPDTPYTAAEVGKRGMFGPGGSS